MQHRTATGFLGMIAAAGLVLAGPAIAQSGSAGGGNLPACPDGSSRPGVLSNSEPMPGGGCGGDVFNTDPGGTRGVGNDNKLKDSDRIDDSRGDRPFDMRGPAQQKRQGM